MCSINHDLKAIYIHIPKNGGVYVEHILKKYYGFQLDYFIKPDNYGFSLLNDEISFPNQNRGALKYYTNSKYINMEYKMSEKMWNEYTKFTFVRNPYTKIISAYEFLKNKYKNSKDYKNEFYKPIEFPTFSEFIKLQQRHIEDPMYQDNVELYCYHYYHCFIKQYEHLLNNKEELNIDFIGKFENLNEDLIDILSKIGVKNPTKHLNEIKNDTRFNVSEKKDISSYIGDEILLFVNEYYNDDFEKFGYPKYTNLNDLYINIQFEKDLEEFSNKNKMPIEKYIKKEEIESNKKPVQKFLFRGSLVK